MNTNGESYYYCIDHNDIISELDEKWDEFALNNNAENVMSENVLGRSLWTFISDRDTRYILGLIVELVRSKKEPINVNFRCDSPALRRYMELDVTLESNNHVRFTNKVLRVEERKPQEWIVNKKTPSNEYVTMCSWCKKVKTPTSWVEAEEALQQLDLLRLSDPPQVSHGICQSCLEYYFSKFKKAQ